MLLSVLCTTVLGVCKRVLSPPGIGSPLRPVRRIWMCALLAATGGAWNASATAQQLVMPLDQSATTAHRSLEKSNLRPLNEIDLSAALVGGSVPVDVAQELEDRPVTTGFARAWHPVNHTWKPSGLCYRPLYFEHVGMERYGQTCCACTAPLVAGAHFYSSVAILPYKMTIEPPCRPTYALGYYRPGSPTPCTEYVIPFDPWALTVQTMAVSGLVLLIP
jgi:hypothetical protein